MAKEDRFYNCGLVRAYELVKAGGIECLEAEMKKRGAYNIPANVNSHQLKNAAREQCERELNIVAISMADTLENDLMMPPSVLADYLIKFHEKCRKLSDDPEEFERVNKRLEEMYAINKTIEIYSCLIDCSVTDYIDWTEGTCNFEQETYRKILQFAKEYGSSVYANEDESNQDEKDIRDGKVLFNIGEVGFTQLQIYDYLYEGECNYIGYPNAKKEGSYFILLIQLGIYIKSEHKEAAWEVIKTFMTKEYQGTMSTDYAMPTRQDCFDWSLKAAMTEESYINDFGIEVEPRDLPCQIGEQIMEFGPLTQQQVDTYVELVKRTNKLGAYYDEITEILFEEAQNYFSGKNSLDETIKYTQNRVNTYIKEKQ